MFEEGPPAKKRSRWSLKGPKTRQGQEVAVHRLSRCQRRKISDVQWGLGLSPHVSRTRSVRLDDVRVEVRQFNEKFNNIQSSLLAVMAKLGIPVKSEVGTPSRGVHPCSVDAGKSNYRRIVSPLARSASKKPTSKVVKTGDAGDLPIVVSPEIPSGPPKTSLGHEKLEHVCHLDGFL